ncbi:hypothetical protein [Ruegeria sp. HKCCD7255]|uniref:hypothetical protein n=1 Tax=Ruegeria sp. HKCCD7255 TaxID=2683004 RepID=UPI001489EDDF|nr:hypothetical protein [Ruegeria sp. HKCCD7255]
MSTSNNKFNTLAKGKTPAPFSLRLTFEERAKLEEAANGLPLGAYIKAKLFGEDLEKVRRRNIQQPLCRADDLANYSALERNGR